MHRMLPPQRHVIRTKSVVGLIATLPPFVGCVASTSNPATSTPSQKTSVAPKIIFVSSHKGKDQIFSMNLDGTQKTRLTNEGKDAENPRLGPNRRVVVFESDRNLHAVNIDGTAKRRLTTGRRHYSGIQFSPDSSKLVFNSTEFFDAALDLFTMSVAGGRPVQLTKLPRCDEREAVFSPDGKKILYVGNTNGKGDQFRVEGSSIVDDSLTKPHHIFEMNTDGTGQRRLSSFRQRDCSEPRYSPDGKRILFTAREKSSKPAVDLYVMDKNGRSVKRLYSAERLNGAHFSPDGTKIAFNFQRGQTSSSVRSVCVMNANRGGLTKVPQSQGQQFGGVKFSPDSRDIIFQVWQQKDEAWTAEEWASGKRPVKEIYISRTDGANKINLTKGWGSCSLADVR